MINSIGNNVRYTANMPVDSYVQPVGGGTPGVNCTSQSDEFVKQEDKEEKKGLSKKAKWGIAGGIAAFGGLIAAALLCKGKTLKPANFAEHIDFKPAQTMEEAVEFAKKHLGIENFNLGDDVEMANWVNEGLVNISNRFKGKANMPKNVIFDEKYFTKNPEAGAYCSRVGDTIAFNKDYFSNKLITKVKNNLKLIFPDYNPKAHEFKSIVVHGEDTSIKNKLAKHYFKILENPSEYTRFDAVNANFLFDDYIAAIKFSEKNPTHWITKCAQNKKVKQLLESNGIDLSVENFNKLSKDKQEAFMKKFHSLLIQNRIKLVGHASHRGNSKFDILYHEMGHLLHNKNTSLSEHFWGRVSGKAEKAFLKDAEKLETAGKISWYAQTNPKEFVAETFNALCAGRKLPDDVMKLYEYYKGPMIPNM